MTEQEKALLQVPAKSISSILNVLHDLRQRQRLGEKIQIPLTTISLHNGKDVHRWLLDKAMDEKEEVAVFQLDSQASISPQLSLAYISISSIQSIILHNAGEIAHLLSCGKIAHQLDSEAPSKFNLKKRCEEVAQQVGQKLNTSIAVEIDWEKSGENEISRFALEDLLNACVFIFATLAQDPLAQSEISKTVKTIQLRIADSSKASLANGLLLIQSKSNEQPSLSSRTNLQKAIEQLF